MRTGQNARVGGQPVAVPRRSRRELVRRVALFAGASAVLLGVVAGCVQSPVANPAPLLLTGGLPTSQAYTPDTVPVVVPPLGSAPDVSTPSGDDPTTDATSADPGAAPAMKVPAATKAAGTAAPERAATKTAEAQAPATQATTAAPVSPTTATATAGTTSVAAQQPIGPGQVELKCTHASDGRSKAVLRWTNSGFQASVTVNGRTTYATSTKVTSLTAYASETTSGHGLCTGRVGDSSAANSY